MIKIERYTCLKDGFSPVKLRKYYFCFTGEPDDKYVWEMMTSPIRGWNESTWSKIPYSEKDILDYISKFGILDGQPCNHVGCMSHVSHPCENCGRIAGQS